jgi:hypothetical protein
MVTAWSDCQLVRDVTISSGGEWILIPNLRALALARARHITKHSKKSYDTIFMSDVLLAENVFLNTHSQISNSSFAPLNKELQR